MTRLVLTFRADQRPLFEALRKHLGARSMAAGLAQLAQEHLDSSRPRGLAAGGAPLKPLEYELGNHGPKDRDRA